MSHYATTCDEAFAILIFENNLDAWIDMGMRKDTSSTEVPRKYTNGGNSKGELGSSQNNKGWSAQGLKRFNELFDKVKENRKAPQAKLFEENFRSYCEDKACSKKKRVKPIEQESFAVRHELNSDNEDENGEKIKNAEPLMKKEKKDSCNDANDAILAYGENNTTNCNSNHETDFEDSENDEDDSEDEEGQPDSDGPVVVPV